jgi:hypothetical protein
VIDEESKNQFKRQEWWNVNVTVEIVAAGTHVSIPCVVMDGTHQVPACRLPALLLMKSSTRATGNRTSLLRCSARILWGRGDAARRPFYGPGIINFDMALHKVTKLTESKSLEFRFETFNTFNHAQFDGNGSVDGNINDATFGQVVKAAPPRISQVALKLFF